MIDKEEIKKVSDTIEIVKSNIEEYEILYSNLLKGNADEQYIQNMSKEYSNKLKNLNKAILVPYFARIDFKEDKKSNVQKIYIGKTGVFDKDYEVVVTDWRAPIASIYYDGQLGKVEYECPDGIIEGNLSKKRVYTIENSELKDYQDIDITTNDEFLQECLNENSEARLKNIISTIQSEQNKIIRAEMSKPLIVQGVAGSGKTTVALHRIAYLVYNNRERINPEQYLVIGPNKFFVNYISSVLPDLDVDNVNQLTYLELCQKSINEKIQLINEEEKLIKSITDMESLEYERFKVSMRFKEALDQYIEQIDKSIVPDEELVIKGYRILPQKIIQKIYNSIGNNIIYNSIEKKIERVKLLLDKYIEKNNVKLERIIKRQYREKIEELSEEEKREDS